MLYITGMALLRKHLDAGWNHTHPEFKSPFFFWYSYVHKGSLFQNFKTQGLHPVAQPSFSRSFLQHFPNAWNSPIQDFTVND